MKHQNDMNIRRIIVAMFISTIIITMITGAEINTTNIIPTTYIIYVDDGLGFYKARNIDTPPIKFEYKDHTLNINQGDTIIWQNDAEKTTFTILSDQNLWNSQIGYLRVGSKFNYKFDVPGKYTLYIKEYSSRRQTIIVNAVESYPAPTITITGESTGTSTFVPTNSSATNSSMNRTSIPTNNTDSPENKSNIKITTIASIVVAMMSIIITYIVGRNKK